MQHHLRENFQPLVLKPVHTLKSPPTNEVLLQSEIPSGMCAELRTVAASNNRDHPARSLSSSPLASTINCSPGSQALLEVTHQDHSIGITLLMLVRATYIYFCSSRTSRSLRITKSTQHHRRGCNITKTLWILQLSFSVLSLSESSPFRTAEFGLFLELKHVTNCEVNGAANLCRVFHDGKQRSKLHSHQWRKLCL